MINPKENYICKWHGKFLHIFCSVYALNYFFISTPTFDEFRKIMKKRFKLEIPEDDQTEGHFEIITKVNKGVDIGVIWVKDRKDYGTIAHECLHAVQWSTSQRGLNLSEETEEAFAYLFSFLVSTIQKSDKK